jgi:hypothetical protein
MGSSCLPVLKLATTTSRVGEQSATFEPMQRAERHHLREITGDPEDHQSVALRCLRHDHVSSGRSVVVDRRAGDDWMLQVVAGRATIIMVAVGGSIELLASIADSELDHRVMAAFGGLLSIAAGVIVVAWPAPTVTVVAWISGFYLIVFGLFICFEAFTMRELTK